MLQDQKKAKDCEQVVCQIKNKQKSRRWLSQVDSQASFKSSILEQQHQSSTTVKMVQDYSINGREWNEYFNFR